MRRRVFVLYAGFFRKRKSLWAQAYQFTGALQEHCQPPEVTIHSRLFALLDRLVYAFASSILYSLRDVTLRKGLVRTHVLAATFLFSAIGTPLGFAFALLEGNLSRVLFLDHLTVGYLFSAGVLHLVVSRLFLFEATSLVGVARTTSLARTSSIFSAVFAIAFLQETVTLSRAVAILAIVTGAVAISLSGETGKTVSWKTPGPKIGSHVFVKGLLYGLATSLVWGYTPVLMKLGSVRSGSPIIGNFVANLASFIVALPIFLLVSKRNHLESLTPRFSRWIIIAAFLGNLAFIVQFVALSLLPVMIVAPIVNSSVLFTIVLAYFIIQGMERINVKVALGASLIVAGVVLLV